MLAALLITLREGLEAALIVGIVLAMLQRLGQMQKGRYVWAGVGVAVAFSLVAALVLNRIGVAFEGRGEEMFEGVAMLLAAVMLTWMIFWMQRASRQAKSSLETKTQRAVSAGSASMLFGLAFLAVVREGLETVLFLTAAAFSSTPGQTILGAAIGLVVAIILGYTIYASGRKLNLRAFFQYTGILLIFFAAGLVAHGVHELQEAALLPVWVEHLYDVNAVLDEEGFVGTLLKALFGYNGNPSLLETIVYMGYLAAIWLVAQRLQRPVSSTIPQR